MIVRPGWEPDECGEGEFDLSFAICLDSRGRIYGGDRENDRIQVFEPGGKFLARCQEEGAPFGMALASDGCVLLADGRANRERALRHAVLWRNSSGGTASEWGSRFVERVLSVAATCRRQGRNVPEFLTACSRAELSGHSPP